LELPKVIHFEIPADDPNRAVEFYSKVFGWKIEKWGPQDYWLAMAGKEDEPGINGAISPRAQLPVTTNTISVPSIDEFTEKITKAGGKVVTPKMPIPGVGYMAYCVDTEGNSFGIMQSDPNAK
jgi:hypothetical protein